MTGVGTWGYQLEALSDAFTVIAWDCPGAGHSSAVPESFRLADYADCLSGFPRALDLAHPYVAGLSFGAVSALELFRRHGEVPQRLILASAYAGWGGLVSFRHRGGALALEPGGVQAASGRVRRRDQQPDRTCTHGPQA